MDTPVLSIQLKLIFISSVWTLDAVEKTYQEQWRIVRESKESMLLARLNDNITPTENLTH